MARTTVDDCLNENDSHFELSYKVARRARDLLRRRNPQVAEEDDKPVVVALRETAAALNRQDEEDA